MLRLQMVAGGAYFWNVHRQMILMLMEAANLIEAIPSTWTMDHTVSVAR